MMVIAADDDDWFCARQDIAKKKVSDFFNELAIWEGYLSKVFSDNGCFTLHFLFKLHT